MTEKTSIGRPLRRRHPGQRPRGIELTKDEKFILVAVGDDDTIQVIDVRTHEIVATLPSGPDPELFTQDQTGIAWVRSTRAGRRRC